MAASAVAQIVTVFGGTGFLGRRIARHLHDKGFAVRIASRHAKPPSGDLQSVAADIQEKRSIASAVAGAFGVVNGVMRSRTPVSEMSRITQGSVERRSLNAMIPPLSTRRRGARRLLFCASLMEALP
jgi:uncharacterized protein YbjT (DUF2867 family)